MTTTTSAR